MLNPFSPRLVIPIVSGIVSVTRKFGNDFTVRVMEAAPRVEALLRKIFHRRLATSAWLSLVVAFLLSGATPRPPKQIVTNSLGMRLAWIPPGEFTMGSPESDPDARADEKPPHRLQIKRGFYLSVHEVTVGQFRAFVRGTNYSTVAEKEGGYGWDRAQGKFVQDRRFRWDNLVLEKADFVQSDLHPVVNVTWEDVTAFSQWLSRREKKRYRLPTEAEWEYSCRAGTSTRYYVGDSLKPDQANWGRNLGGPAPVGSYLPNAFGLFDMHANVWEFCLDWHDDAYYPNSPFSDPPGPNGPGSSDYRVRRGGDWLHGSKDSRSAARYVYNYRPQARYNVIMGFRVLLER